MSDEPDWVRVPLEDLDDYAEEVAAAQIHFIEHRLPELIAAAFTEQAGGEHWRDLPWARAFFDEDVAKAQATLRARIEELNLECATARAAGLPPTWPPTRH